MISLKVFEINFYYLVVAESAKQAVEFFILLTSEPIHKMRECSVEKEGFVVFNEATYRMKTFQEILCSMMEEQETINIPFVLRAKPIH
ncbi:hypothetical protein CVD28_00375 [Bacillus sp. M6-12]|uniref:hypothetical protein n=1 Tax=Bacillus sp. M6-12 TaxID=2054166 RepID=UPI000C79264A|nr:hypothetical protein [Bacillus sp. M6-12]PLS18890.1 hypothetical protein CVD28_00375 [Bacillus sp. M6-12]